MAVTISEMHVEVKEAPPTAAPSANSGADAKKDVNLSQALDMLRERHLRLKAD